MGKALLEAFSDGVMAIMVLELKVPHGDDLAALSELWPVFLSYILSFIYAGIYWNNHHQPAPVVLAVADALHHRLDGREPFRGGAGGD